MDLTPPPASNIVGIDPDSQKELEIRKAARDGFPCSGQHKSVIVNSKLRTVTCEHCGHAIDPFKYMEQWADEGERRMTGLKGLDTKIRIARAEFDRLEKDIDNARATLKRAGKPQPQRERDEYKNAIWNSENPHQRISVVQPAARHP